MADNSARIAEIETLLASGLRAAAADGESATYDPDSLRRELSRLRASDDSARRRRPFAANINLGGTR